MTSHVNHRLSYIQNYALTKLIIEKYAESALSDQEFRKIAEEQLGFLVGRVRVARIRRELDIPPNQRPVKGKPLTWRATMEGGILSLTRRVDELEAALVMVRRELAKCKGYNQALT